MAENTADKAQAAEKQNALKRLEEPASVAARRGQPLDEVAPAALVSALQNQKAGV
jgi:small subunit ribosomal protein S5